MDITRYLDSEWKPALGCTEPAAVAWAASLAASQGSGAIRSVRLRCDARTYKNCYAVGIPNSNRATGILWAEALGANLPDGSLGLSSFEGITGATIETSGVLLGSGSVSVDIDSSRTGLMIEVTVVREQGTGRALLLHDHGNLARLEKDGVLVRGEDTLPEGAKGVPIRQLLAEQPIESLMDLARTLSREDRAKLQRGFAMNMEIARHGLGILPDGFAGPGSPEAPVALSHLVSAGVFARMSGESNPVMTLAGSGNKGITLSIPVFEGGRRAGHAEERVEEALAFGCLMTSAATWHLGTLSAICGAANVAGIGIASAFVFLEGGSHEKVSLAINTMVGNLAGMICDGAKIGCAMKTLTGVEAAFRAASMALAGMGIPATDGIVGKDGRASLSNLGRLAQVGMAGVDTEILRIMQDKLRP